MKRILALALIATAAGTVAGTASAQASVSIGINQPGVYGRINIGELPRPALVQAEPVLIAPPPVAVPRRPIYLYVPVEHQRNWARYCGRYNACGQPVYFVQDQWVRERYAEGHPDWARSHRYYRDEHRDERHDDHRDDRRDDRR